MASSMFHAYSENFCPCFVLRVNIVVRIICDLEMTPLSKSQRILDDEVDLHDASGITNEELYWNMDQRIIKKILYS